MSFHVGQKIECIDDDWAEALRRRPFAGRRLALPRKGCIYHVRWIAGDPSYVLLSEIVNPDLDDSGEPVFIASYFRPVIERSTESGMTMLRAILDHHKQPTQKPIPERV